LSVLIIIVESMSIAVELKKPETVFEDAAALGSIPTGMLRAPAAAGMSADMLVGSSVGAPSATSPLHFSAMV
jgi:hypothetical protein